MDLQEKLRERDEGEMDRTKNKEDPKKALALAGDVFSNPAALLKIRKEKWHHNNREKKQLMDIYTRNVRIIEDAFE